MSDIANDTSPEEETEEPEVNPIEQAFQDTLEANANATEDQIKLAMINAGASFKNVGRLFAQCMVDGGYAMSKDEKDDMIKKLMEKDSVSIATENGLVAAVEKIVGSGVNIDRKQATSIIRSYAKKNDIEMWKKPAGTGGGGRVGFRDVFFKAVRADPTMSEKALDELMTISPESSDNVRKQKPWWNAIRKLANEIAAQYQGAPA